MKQTTIYLPEEIEASLQELATSLQELAKKRGNSISELIEEVIDDYLIKTSQKLPKSMGMGASGRSDLSSKAEQLLWTED